METARCVPPIKSTMCVSHFTILSMNLVKIPHKVNYLISSPAQANLKFCAKLIRGLAPMPMVGPKVRLLTSSGASSNFQSKATSTVKGTALISSLKDGIPEIEKGDVCVLVSPSVSKDYQAAKQIASDGVAGALVIVNGLAKVRL